MHKLTVDQFIGYCWEVVAWNKVSRGDHDFSESTTLKQLDYCLEELQEAIQGYEDNNLTEILDGLADSLVTLSYLLFLLREGKEDCFDSHNLGYWSDSASQRRSTFHSTLEGDCRSLRVRLKTQEVEAVLGDVLAALNDLSDKANISGVIEEVLDSNWSKFPYLDQVIPMEECKWIEKNRGKEGVYHAVIGNKVVFRDKGGKIVKPSTFKEPNIQKHIYKEEVEIKIGSVVRCVEEGTSLSSGTCYEVEEVLEDLSVIFGDVVYGVRCLRTDDNFCMQDSWLKERLVVVLEGDKNDEYKTDISEQVEELREKISFPQEPTVLDTKVNSATR